MIKDRLEYGIHVRPFCKMMKRTAKVLGDREVFRRAVNMQVKARDESRMRSVDRERGWGERRERVETVVRGSEEDGALDECAEEEGAGAEVGDDDRGAGWNESNDEGQHDQRDWVDEEEDVDEYEDEDQEEIHLPVRKAGRG